MVSPNDLAPLSANPNIDRSLEQDRARLQEMMDIESSDPGPSDDDLSQVAEPEVADDTLDTLPLRWKGLTSSDLHAM